MEGSGLFYKYYDDLFASKDYKGEVTAVIRHFSGCQKSQLRDILEIGCGTGNHTIELAKTTGVQITAVDTDPVMLKMAQQKVLGAGITNVAFASVVTTQLAFDLCVALFNVVNYLCSDDDLHNFFADIARSLRSGGTLVFDCWNGLAALLDPPGSKNYEQQCGDIKVCCHLTSQTDIVNKFTTLSYRLELLDRSNVMVDSGCHQFRHKLWTPAQIGSALAIAGFQVGVVCLPFRFDQLATDRDWKIMFVCKKV